MSKKTTQKILVPKGTINPDEDTLIEIPGSLKEQPVVVIKKHDSEKSVKNERSTRSIRSSRIEYEDDDGIFNTTQRSRTRVKVNEIPYIGFSPGHNSTTTTMYESAKTSTSPAANLDETEIAEKMLIQKKLEEFQQARREFLLESTSVATKSSQVLPHTNYTMDQIPYTSYKQNYPERTPRALTHEYSKPEEHWGTTSGKSEPNQSKQQRLTPFEPKKSTRVQTDLEADLDEEEEHASCLLQNSSNTKMATKRAKNGYKLSCTKITDGKLCKSQESTSTSTMPLPEGIRSSPSNFTHQCNYELKKSYMKPSSNIDKIYLQQLRRQFQEAKRKLDEAILLASLSLKQTRCGTILSTEPTFAITPKPSESLYDTTPVRDVSGCYFKPLCPSDFGSPTSPIKNKSSFQGNEFLNINEYESKTKDRKSFDTRESERIKETVCMKANELKQALRKIQADPVNDSLIITQNISKVKILTSNVPCHKDTMTQTKTKNIDESSVTNLPKSLKQKKSKSLPGCSGSCKKIQESNLIKFVQEPKLNFHDNESLFEEEDSSFKKK